MTAWRSAPSPPEGSRCTNRKSIRVAMRCPGPALRSLRRSLYLSSCVLQPSACVRIVVRTVSRSSVEPTALPTSPSAFQLLDGPLSSAVRACSSLNSPCSRPRSPPDRRRSVAQPSGARRTSRVAPRTVIVLSARHHGAWGTAAILRNWIAWAKPWRRYSENSCTQSGM